MKNIESHDEELEREHRLDELLEQDEHAAELRKVLFDEQKHVWHIAVNFPIAVQSNSGVTRHSLQVITVNKSKLKELAFIECMMPLGKGYADCKVRFIDTRGVFIQVDGLSWGYGGEGPNGLVKALQMFTPPNVRPITIEEVAGWGVEHVIIDAKTFVANFNCKC